MKNQLKQILGVSVFACALSVQATDVASSENVFGLLAVSSATTNTIVGTPWLATGGGAVVVSNLVKTTNLTVGDKLYVINGFSKYDGWQLVAGGYWSPIGKFSIGADGQMTADAGVQASDQTVTRGQGVWLVRNNPTDGSGNPNLFYLYGQASTTPVTTTITAGTEKAPTWHLVASASSTAEPFNFNSGITGTVNAKDTIVIPTDTNPSILTYVNSAWCRQASSNYTHSSGIKISVPYLDTNPTVPAGTGFWYVSRGGSPTITW